MSKPITTQEFQAIRARCDAAKKYWRHVPPSDVFACLDEIEGLRDVLRAVLTKHTLLQGLAEYPPCRCKSDKTGPCMKHAAIDILGMITKALAGEEVE